MTLQQVKQAVNNGQAIVWGNPNYIVVKWQTKLANDKWQAEYYVKCVANSYAVLLTEAHAKDCYCNKLK